MWLIPWGDVNI